MSDPFGASGGASAPSPYATLYMDREITGMWTQRSPFRDAAVPYIQAKGYNVSRFDSMIDGLNWELKVKLTGGRAPGSSVWNSNTFDAINSFYAWKYIQDTEEIIRTIVDCTDSHIYDATANSKTDLFTKTGAKKTRFLGVNTELFFGDGIDTQKIVQSQYAWGAHKTFTPGSFIVDSNRNLQVAYGDITVAVTNIAIDTNVLTVTLDPNDLNLPDNLMWLVGLQLTFSGLTTATFLNGQTVTIDTVPQGVPATASNVFTASFTHADYPSATDTGSVTSGAGETGATQPAWSTTRYDWTQDGSVQWLCYGPNLEKWGIAAPMVRPTTFFQPIPNPYVAWSANTFYKFDKFIMIKGSTMYELTTSGDITDTEPVFDTTPGHTTTWGTAVFTSLGTQQFWTAATAYKVGDIIGATQICINAGTSGATEPPFTIVEGAKFSDGTNGLLWEVIGGFPSADQLAAEASGGITTVAKNNVILDSNGYLQQIVVSSPGAGLVLPGESGASAPAWSTAPGNSTIDGGLTWLNMGAWAPAGTDTTKYYFSWKSSLTQHVSTASPASGAVTNIEGSSVVVQGPSSTDPQVDTIVVWRPAQGQATPVYVDEFPQPRDGGVWSYNDQIPDTSETGGPELIPQLIAPINNVNDPPPATVTAPVYHLQRIWTIADNMVQYSGGPDTLVGSGNEAFPPLNIIPYPEQPIKLRPITVNNGGLLVYTTSNVYIILGTGTDTNPFYTTIYMPNVGILNYDAEDIVGSTAYMMTTKKKFVSFDPSAGYAEQGFPIGDQFMRTTTGGIDEDLYDPKTAYVTWHEQNTTDTAVYVADGAVGWWRFGPTASPDNGFTWSPRRQIVGGTSAVQSVETEPGTNQLLIGPPTGTPGPILFRDDSLSADWSDGQYRDYPAWFVMGNIVLCQSGEIAEIAHIALKSTLTTGKRPVVSLLLGEIRATQLAPFESLSITSPDPPMASVGGPSLTYFSDRYSALQNGLCPKCDNFQLKIDYGSQNQPDELLTFAIYGRKYAERGR